MRRLEGGAVRMGTLTRGRWVVPAVILFSIICNLEAQDLKLSQAGIDQIDARLQDAVDTQEIPGVVAIVANSKEILYHQAFGKRDVLKGLQMEKDTIFGIASMTKPVTSVAVMRLVEEGKLKLDDPVSRYLSSLKELEVLSTFEEETGRYTAQPVTREVTIRHLLTHTSGLGYNFSSPLLSRLETQTGRTQTDLPLLHQPGERWTYGMSTRILGDLVELLTQESMPRYYERWIFDPLGMHDTFYSLPPEKVTRWSTRHRRENGTLKEVRNPQQQRPSPFGDRGLLSTAADYIRFLQMLLNGGTLDGRRILSEDSVRLMTRNQIGSLVVETQSSPNPSVSRDFPLGAGRDNFGLGFQITVSSEEGKNLRSPGSYSWSGLSNTHFWADPEKQIAAVILMQVLPFYDEACIRVYQDFEELIYRHIE